MYQRLIVLLLIFEISSCEILCGQVKNSGNNDSCLSYFENNDYSYYWKKDSLGKNGFRQLMADIILTKCHFDGKKWAAIKKYLGNPNLKSKFRDGWIYRYRLNYMGKDIREVVTMLMTIEVDKTGLIVRFAIDSVDG